jgi:hypothetical protein
MDVHVRRAVTVALRLRSVDVLTAQEDGAAQLEDGPLLQRASDLGRVLVSQDEDLLREGHGDYGKAFTFAASFTLTSSESRSVRWWRILRCSRRRHRLGNGTGGSNTCRSDEVPELLRTGAFLVRRADWAWAAFSSFPQL